MKNATKGGFAIAAVFLTGFILAGLALNNAPADPPDGQSDGQSTKPTAEEMAYLDKSYPGDALLFRLAEQDQDKTGNAKYLNYLYYLANVDGNILSEVSFYKAIIEKAVATKDKSVLPLITKTITDIDFNDLEGNTPSRMRLELLNPLSKAWYDLTWDSATDEQKIESALYGLTPGAKIPLYPDQSKEKCKLLGKKARAKVYDVLLNNKTEYDETVVYYVWMQATMAGMLCGNDFSPTDKEVQDVLEKGGKFGKMAMIRCLWYKNDPRCIEATIAIVKEFNRSESIFQQLKRMSRKLNNIPVEKKMPLIKFAIDLAREMNTIRQTPGATFPSEMGPAFSFAVTILNDMGKTPESVAYLKEWSKTEDGPWLTHIANTLNAWGESVSDDPSIKTRLEDIKKSREELETQLYGQPLTPQTGIPSTEPTTTSAPTTQESK